MLLYSRKKVRYRRDGYCWKKRKDGKTTREDHMKLKVQGTEVSLSNPQTSADECVELIRSANPFDSLHFSVAIPQIKFAPE